MQEKTTVMIGALSLCAGLAAAQGSWTAVGVTGDPDPLYSFDLSDPAGSLAQFGTLAGNFNRGFDWSDQNTAYFHVSTDTLNDPGDAGIYRYDAMSNTSTQLAAFGFSDNGTGGGAYYDGGYWLTIDDGTGGDSLYRYDLGSGMMAKIGDTGLTNVQGVAIDDAGRIFAIDTGRDALFELSSTNGSAGIVGMLGINASAVGGLDFGPGGTLVAVTDFGNLYEIDASTGAAGTFFGSTGVNVSALAYRVPTPGAMGVLALGGLVAARRRR